MPESTSEDQVPKTEEIYPYETVIEMLAEAKKAFVLMVAVNEQIDEYLARVSGRLTKDQIKAIRDTIQQGRSLACAVSPWTTFDEIDWDVSRCRSCGKLTWIDGTATKYCPVCIRSTNQTV